MGVFEALRVLEIRELKGLTDQDIKKAYRKLMGKHHPDKGGDVGKAQLLNEAYGIALEAIKRLKVLDNKNTQAVVLVGFEGLLEIYRGGSVSGKSELGEVSVDRKNIRILNTYVEIEMGVIIGSFVSRFSSISKWAIKDEYTIHGYVDCVDIKEELDVVVRIHGKEVPLKIKGKAIISLNYGYGVKLRVILEKRRIRE